MKESKDYSTLTLTFYSEGEGERRKKRGEIFGEGEYLFFRRRRKTEKEKEGNIWRRFLQKLSRILKSLSFSLGLETFANFWRVSISVSENLVLEKSMCFGFRKFGLGKKSLFRFWKIWYRKKSLGIGFGQNFGIALSARL